MKPLVKGDNNAYSKYIYAISRAFLDVCLLFLLLFYMCLTPKHVKFHFKGRSA